MLLRRMMTHVRDQNWVAVGLDFLIVVLGVFIGLQAANWNEVRNERANEATYLKSLHADLAASANLLDGHLAHIARRQHALSTLANAEKGDIAREGFDDLMRMGLYELEFLSVQRNTYQALENAGRIGLLRDIALQQALVDQSVQIAAIRDYEADMARFQHRWVDEFLLSEYHLGNVIAFEAAGTLARRDDATDYRDLLDDMRIRNLAAFLYDILNEQRQHAEALGGAYADSAARVEARLERLGASE
ncbi:MAG: hypothetical protein H2040_12295 [Euryhalocaulis sp.]|uniref:hypothetical protein n=1 Tax=Euryhalocaulis sp. TaxID=2744307 RepID=UPI0018087FA6|nr:hypothetical protein [Euryhalocaulis sp.]MBA4802632.1 hypothetical protein [Euryhalocaulis sp.]